MGVIFEPFVWVLAIIVDIYFKVVVIEVALHWLIHFKIISADNKYSKKLVELLKMVTEPVYSKIRAKLPPLAGFDIAPFALLLALLLVSRILMNLSTHVLL